MIFRSRWIRNRVCHAGDENSRARHFRDHDAASTYSRALLWETDFLGEKEMSEQRNGDKASRMVE